MNTKAIEGKWTELKEKIKSKWGKFSEDEVEAVKGDLDQLAGRIQTAYGIAKDQADIQYSEFKKSVQSLLGQEAVAETAAAPKLNLVTPLPVGKPGEKR